VRSLQVILLALGVPLSASAQARVIDHTKARMYLNEDVIIEGPVARVDRGRGGVLWFSLGKPHPGATVVVVVPSQFTGNFDNPRAWEGKTVQVSGRLTTGEAEGIITGRSTDAPRNPFIVLEDPSRLKIVVPVKPIKP
jgi:hypothetical protein